MSRQWRSDDTSPWTHGFGDGHDGSTYATPAYAGCSGTISTKAVTIDTASTFADGDLVLIHQSRGTSAGVWELNKIASGGGTTSLTMEHDLMNTYTDSGASQAQIMELKEYEDLTISTTVNPPAAWNQNKGGIVAFLDKGTTTISGSINVSAYGYIGGYSRNNVFGGAADQGEGTAGAGTLNNPANGNGGGGGRNYSANKGYGGGGGNGTAGANGGAYQGTGGTGGVTAGNAALTTMVFGGAGGGGITDNTSTPVVDGGDGGGIVLIIAQNIVITGTINLNGGTHATSGDAKPGAAAGGSCLLKCVTATLGTTKITATGGVASGGGGSGGVGRIHIDYSTSYTGTTSPTIDATLDSTIVPPSVGGAAFLAFFM